MSDHGLFGRVLFWCPYADMISHCTCLLLFPRQGAPLNIGHRKFGKLSHTEFCKIPLPMIDLKFSAQLVIDSQSQILRRAVKSQRKGPMSEDWLKGPGTFAGGRARRCRRRFDPRSYHVFPFSLLFQNFLEQNYGLLLLLEIWLSKTQMPCGTGWVKRASRLTIASVQWIATKVMVCVYVRQNMTRLLANVGWNSAVERSSALP